VLAAGDGLGIFLLFSCIWFGGALGCRLVRIYVVSATVVIVLFFFPERCLFYWEGSGCRRRIPGAADATRSALASVGAVAHATPSVVPRACVCA
jgi:hypothetical protein